MENRSLALKLVSEAVHLDSNGFIQGAFPKYLQSLQILALYLNELFESLGFQKMMEKTREIKHVSCMIHECSDRIIAIADRVAQRSLPTTLILNEDTLRTVNKQEENISPTKVSGLLKLQNENVTLLKTYQWRFERAKDNYARTNLKLELERRLAENDVLAKKKFDILAVKQLQKERADMMEKEMKKLCDNRQNLNEKEREKRDLYVSVLDYAKTETWPCTWKLSSYEFSDQDVVRKIFQKTVKCTSHPLSQWLILVQTNLKRDIDTTLKHYTQYQNILPSILSCSQENLYRIQEVPDEYIFHAPNFEQTSISKHFILSLQKKLQSISSEIMNVISNILQIFYLAYKSLLPEDTEEICLSLIESYILESIWPNLIILYRISNIVAEYKTLEMMVIYKDSEPLEFGLVNRKHFDSALCEKCITPLKAIPYSGSLTEKLRILVQVSHIICGQPEKFERTQRNVLGADEFIPLLCYIIVKSKLPQLSSECYAIEQLFYVDFMFGEEGYALSSFLTALKYIEMKKLIDGENNANKASAS